MGACWGVCLWGVCVGGVYVVVCVCWWCVCARVGVYVWWCVCMLVGDVWKACLGLTCSLDRALGTEEAWLLRMCELLPLKR